MAQLCLSQVHSVCVQAAGSKSPLCDLLVCAAMQCISYCSAASCIALGHAVLPSGLLGSTGHAEALGSLGSGPADHSCADLFVYRLAFVEVALVGRLGYPKPQMGCLLRPCMVIWLQLSTPHVCQRLTAHTCCTQTWFCCCCNVSPAWLTTYPPKLACSCDSTQSQSEDSFCAD